MMRLLNPEHLRSWLTQLDLPGYSKGSPFPSRVGKGCYWARRHAWEVPALVRRAAPTRELSLVPSAQKGTLTLSLRAATGFQASWSYPAQQEERIACQLRRLWRWLQGGPLVTTPAAYARQVQQMLVPRGAHVQRDGILGDVAVTIPCSNLEPSLCLECVEEQVFCYLDGELQPHIAPERLLERLGDICNPRRRRAA